MHVTTYSSAAGETPATVLPKLIRTYPDVIVVRDVADLDTLSILCEQAGENRLVITSIRAKEAVEALLRVMMLKIPPAEFAAAVDRRAQRATDSQACARSARRAIRRRPKCSSNWACRPGASNPSIARPPQPIDPKHPDVVCDAVPGRRLSRPHRHLRSCSWSTSRFAQVLTTAPKMENLRAAARKGKHRTLQEEGVLLVARGVTSIQELLRVLKQ